jgi:hypothetical protein
MTKENLLKHIEAMKPEQIEFLGNLLNFAQYPDYQLNIKLSGLTEEENRKIDSATPHEYNKAITEIYPDFINGRNVFNYNKNNFGEMLNLNNLIIQNIKTVLKLKTL